MRRNECLQSDIRAVQNAAQKKERDAYFDNLKLGCIFLVVFAHFLESATGGGAQGVYKAIYLFHIPLFVFISGVFTKFSLGKTIKRVLLPCVIAQVVYTVFSIFALGEALKWDALYKPYWLTWYLLSLFFWKMTAFVLDKLKTRGLWIVLACAVVLALAFGFVKMDGYVLSLSRTVVFYPFFVAGYLFKRVNGAKSKWLYSLPVKIASLILAVAAFALYFVLFGGLEAKVLYGSFVYARVQGYHIGVRALVMACGAFGVFAALVLAPKKRNVLSLLGKNTMTAYLGHGFVVRILERFDVMQKLPCPIAFALLFAVGTIALCEGLDCLIAFLKTRREKRIAESEPIEPKDND